VLTKTHKHTGTGDDLMGWYLGPDLKLPNGMVNLSRLILQLHDPTVGGDQITCITVLARPCCACHSNAVRCT